MEKKEKQRTSQQNRALHLYFTLLAQTLNDAGLDMRKTLKPSVDIPWSGKTVKDHLWRPIQKAQLKKNSTKDVSIDEVTKVYETLNRHLAEKFGMTVPFPSLEEIMFKSRKYEN